MYKRILIITLVLFSLLLLTSCVNKGINGLKIGFNYDTSPQDILIAIKSDQSEFDVNDIKLDFYYGIENPLGVYSDEKYEFVTVTLFFCSYEFIGNVVDGDQFEDFYNIEGYHFIKEIDKEEFTTTNYNASMKFSGIAFKYHETLSVPKELFTYSKGYLDFRIFQISYNNENKSYIIGPSSGYIIIEYEYINDQTIRFN